MADMFRAVCRACGWSGATRHPNPAPRHRCPKCGSADLTVERP